MMNTKNINKNVVMDVEVDTKNMDTKDRKMDTRMKVTTERTIRKTHLQH